MTLYSIIMLLCIIICHCVVLHNSKASKAARCSHCFIITCHLQRCVALTRLLCDRFTHVAVSGVFVLSHHVSVCVALSRSIVY